MAEVKIVIGEKTGKSYQKNIESPEPLIGRVLGETLKGDIIGFSGYEFLITGGSDHCGVPMRKDIKGARRARILAHSGVGIKIKEKGKLIRKAVIGNTIGEKIAQINLKVTKQGTKKLDEIFNPKEEETQKEESKEVKKEEPKEAKPDAKKD